MNFKGSLSTAHISFGKVLNFANMKSGLFCLLIVLLFQHLLLLKANAQTVVFEEQVDTNPDFSSFGPNKKNFMNYFIGFGFIVGPSEGIGSAIKYGASTDLQFGLSYKRKIFSFYAAGLEAYYHGNNFSLKQDLSKTLPNSNLNKNEVLRFYNIGLSFFNRINVGKRGNVIGNFLDIGANAEFPFSVVHDVKNDGDNNTIVRTLTSHLDYINKYGLYLFTRIGSNRYAMRVSYRFSDLFKTNESYNFAELPRIVISAHLGLHK